jgi:dTDP-4-dehydrorhamnose reductase
MLGWQVSKYFSNEFFDLTLTFRRRENKIKLQKIIRKSKNIEWKKFDILKTNSIKLNIFLKKFDYIINCAGIIKPEINEMCSSSILNCLKINSYFPHLLNEQKRKETKVFQIATDCVYDGQKGMYNENFSHDALDVYGKSKSMGEVNAENFYNLRVSIIGKEIKDFKSLLSWFLRSKNKKINGFQDHLWNGITTLAYAKFVHSIIRNKFHLPNVLHILPKNQLSKFELLKLFSIKFFNIKILKKISSKRINRTLSTIHSQLIKKIWLKSDYKKVPTIQELINEI